MCPPGEVPIFQGTGGWPPADVLEEVPERQGLAAILVDRTCLRLVDLLKRRDGQVDLDVACPVLQDLDDGFDTTRVSTRRFGTKITGEVVPGRTWGTISTARNR